MIQGKKKSLLEKTFGGLGPSHNDQKKDWGGVKIFQGMLGGSWGVLPEKNIWIRMKWRK